MLVEPATGRTVASVREEATGDSEFLPAVHRLSNRVRARLGEALADIEVSARALEKVTTPSLSTLQLFSEADGLIDPGKSDVAEGLLRQAVAEDPDFASGYILLAWTIRNQHRPAPEYLLPAERAVALAARVSERERYFILGSYHQMLGMASRAALDEDLATIEDEQAVTVYEALVRLYPDHYWGTSNLVGLTQRLGRQEKAWRWRVRRAGLRPTNLPGTLRLARHFLRIGDVAAAEPYLERARALASAEGTDPRRVVQASFLEVDAAWAGGDAAQALAALNEVVASGPPQTGTARLRELNGSRSTDAYTPTPRDLWLSHASHRYLTLGCSTPLTTWPCRSTASQVMQLCPSSRGRAMIARPSETTCGGAPHGRYRFASSGWPVRAPPTKLGRLSKRGKQVHVRAS